MSAIETPTRMSRKELLDALEQDGRPSFAMDIQIAQALVPDIVVMRRNNDDTGNVPHTYRSFTADVGDALWLFEALLPGTYWFFAKGQTRPDEPMFGFQVLTSKPLMGEHEAIAEAEHDNAPTAVLLGLLRALEAREQAND